MQQCVYKDRNNLKLSLSVNILQILYVRVCLGVVASQLLLYILAQKAKIDINESLRK